jgi:hypothetical protein
MNKYDNKPKEANMTDDPIVQILREAAARGRQFHLVRERAASLIHQEVIERGRLFPDTLPAEPSLPGLEPHGGITRMVQS